MSGPFSEFARAEQSLWADTFGENFMDRTAQALFHEGYFAMEHQKEELSAVRQALQDYLADTYGFDFEAEFDWVAWREAYEGTEG